MVFRMRGTVHTPVGHRCQSEYMEQTAEIYPIDSSRRARYRPPPVDLASPEGSSFDLFALIWRRRGLLLGTVLIVTLFSLLAAYQITPRYAASVRLMIGGTNDLGAGALSQMLGGRDGARAELYGELEIMQSDRLLELAVTRLGLVNDPEFNRSLLGRWGDAISSIDMLRPLAGYLGTVREDGLSPAERIARQRQLAVNTLRDQLEIRPPRLSNVVSVTVRSTDPQKAARIANALVDVYISDNLERRVRASAEARAWLDERIAKMRRSVVESERAVAEFLMSSGLVESGRNAVIERQFADVSSQLTAAKASYAEKQTRLAQVIRLRDTEQGLAAAKEVRESPLIQRLRDQEAALERRVAELEPNFGELHPRMVNLRAELGAARQRIQEEQVRIVQELENEVRVARARVVSLTNELEKIDSERLASGEDAVRLRQLQRDAEANQRLYETYLARLKQAGMAGDVLGDNAVQIVSSARPPISPIYPRKGMIVGLGFIASFGIGIFLIFLSERLDRGFRDVDQLETLTGTPIVGVVPRMATAEKDGRACANSILAAPESSYGEAIRSLRTGLMVSNVDMPPKIILVASALPGEGKTSLAVSLARQSAVSSVRGNVILIDCDLRRPAVSGVMGLRAEIGLKELFSGEASLEDVLKIDAKSGLHVLPVTPGTPNPPELLNSQHMRDLLARLSDNYDLVIIDSPALESVSDARVLAHLADATVFVVQWETTPRQTVLASLRQLRSAGARIAGLAFHKVNEKTGTKAKYGYGEVSSL